MHLYPKELFTKLEFDRILSLLSKYALGEPAGLLCINMRIFDRKEKIEGLLSEVEEYRLSIAVDTPIPLHHYVSISSSLGALKTENMVLELEEYQAIYWQVKLVEGLAKFALSKESNAQFPRLCAIIQQVNFDPEIVAKFDKIFDEEGQVKASASSTLQDIVKSIGSTQRNLDKRFASIVQKYLNTGYLTDNLESYKNGRRVLSVLVEKKRKIKGIVHDESATGRTVFIEPEEIIELNNDLFELEAKKKHEIYKILRAFSNYLRPYLEDFLSWQRVIVRLDLIRAKALFANTYSGVKPSLNNDEDIKLVEAYHPLLFLLNKEAQKPTIPFDLELDDEKRILVVSGPNGGGKSVALKAMGLLQLMLQAGMPLPVQSHSNFRIFNKFMIDIGDQQSLDGDLSTYTSRLIHMKHFVKAAQKSTLVLIDEFGSGSDPKMGGAIAEGVLDALVQKKCFGFITTHYSNIKNYAYKSKAIVNGAMLFDKDELSPTFRLKLGQPGSSFAFEISEKIGLPKFILTYAKKKAGKDSKTVDKLLIDLQHEKKELEDQLLKAYDERRDLNRLIKNYDSMKDTLEIRKKRMKLAEKEKSYFDNSKYEKELELLIRQLKKEKNLELAQEKLNKLKTQKEANRVEIKEIANEVYKVEVEELGELSLGQYVKLKSGGATGKIVAISDKKVKLEMGNMSFEVSKNELMSAQVPIERKTKSIHADTVVNPYAIDTELDIRGYSKMEALDSIQEFLDNALMANNITRLKIIHGKGTGVLKKTLWTKSKEYRDIKKIWHPEEEFGGASVTYIKF